MHTIKDVVKQLIGKSLDAYNKKYTSPINNRIDTIVAQAGTDNTEIVDARIDSAGVTHTTLNNRILAETKMTDEKLIEYTGSSLSVDDTMPGYLQNIEIKGNTIQNEDNLEDIRSVGDKIEGQELYEIPVLSVGKNLFNSTFEIGGFFWNNGLDNNNELDRVRSGFIKINPNATYRISEKNKLSPIFTHIFFFDKNKTFISFGGSLAEIPNNTSYIRFLRMGNGTSTKIYLQIEECTVATEYEPYQEDKLTILSPVQLEKVGDVADRIIYKDGVWGVEKNIGVYYTNGNETIYTYNTSTANTIAFRFDFITTNTRDIIVEGFSYRHDDSDIEHCLKTSNDLIIYLNRSRIETQDVQGFSKWLKDNKLKIIYQTTTPQFIPLPHDQQIKLRTFANKTNISFLTEIEGTIKAQVPKSLGATVNTHTTQISNLNKELDRVKKLEESTVSTVTTESDFTTVEATSNGYFEDVKLKGKTLVNLWDISKMKKASSISVADNYVTVNADGSWIDCHPVYTAGAVPMLKPNTEYTVITHIKNNTLNSYMSLNVDNANRSPFTKNITIEQGFTGYYICKLTTKTDLSKSDTSLRCQIGSQCTTGTIVFNCILLEGDHTQNPPNGYIEGLKSVGQDVDEIVVSSVNENLFDKNQTLINGYISMRYDYGLGVIVPSDGCRATDFIRVDSNTTYTLNNDNNIDETCGFYDATKKCITVVRGNIVTSPSNAKYMRCTIKRSDFEQGFQIVRGTQTTEYTPHQADKKRLLFYNNETQAWEKPILREWDSIEKHADGKYYYHQRSGEVVLNGSEDWIIDNDATKETSLHFRLNGTSYNLKPTNNNYSNAEFICDKFTLRNADFVWSTNTQNPNGVYEGIAINSSSFICVRVLKSKLSTQDVAGFKQWLQTNNVTVVYQLAQEKVYECTNIDLITYANETNYVVESGAIVPKTTLKVHNNISNVVSLLQKKVSLLESNMTKYMVTQNRMQLASTYSTDSVTFKVDYFSLCGDEENYDEDLYNLILNNILVGKDNYDYDKMFTMILDYASWNQISWEQFDILVGLMDIQHNPPIEELPPEDVIEEDIIENETPVE